MRNNQIQLSSNPWKLYLLWVQYLIVLSYFPPCWITCMKLSRLCRSDMCVCVCVGGGVWVWHMVMLKHLCVCVCFHTLVSKTVFLSPLPPRLPSLPPPTRQQAGSNVIPSSLSRLPITSHSVATVSKATERSGCQAPGAMHVIVALFI